MTSPDTRTRALERDMDPEAAGALLRERIRAGEVPERHVRLAAWLGYPPALSAAEPEVPDEDTLGERQLLSACRVVKSALMTEAQRMAVLQRCQTQFEGPPIAWNGDGGFYWDQAKRRVSAAARELLDEDVALAVGSTIHAVGRLAEEGPQKRFLAEVLCWGPPS